MLKPSSGSSDKQIAAASAAHAEASLSEPSPPPVPPSASSAAATGETWESFVQEENANGKEVYASIAPEPNGVREVLLASTEQKKFELGPTQSHALPPGSGLQLVALPTWQWKVNPGDDPDLVVSAVDGDGYRLSRLKAFGVPFILRSAGNRDPELRNGGFRADHKHLWSHDGKNLYVMAGNPRHETEGPKQLLKVNAETWQGALRASGGIEDISWCSEGIAMMHTNGGGIHVVGDTDLTPWFPLTTSKRRGSSLVILDPKTLMPKKAWSMPRMQRIAGCAASDIVYAVADNSYLAAINVKSGQVLKLDYANKDFQSPQVSPDGRWLIAGGLDGALNRFRISGADLILEQKRPNTGKSAAVLSPDGSQLVFRGRDRFYAVQTDDFDKTIGSVTGSEIGKAAVDTASKTTFVCGEDDATKALTMRIMQGQGDVQIKLTDESNAASAAKHTAGSRTANELLPRGTELSAAFVGQVPFAMSAAPQGRGAIVFTLDAVYWVEVRGQGSDWVFNAKEPAKVSAVEALKDTSAETARLTIPDPVTKPFEITRVNRESPGRVFQLPAWHNLNSVDVDPQTGDVACYPNTPSGAQMFPVRG